MPPSETAHQFYGARKTLILGHVMAATGTEHRRQWYRRRQERERYFTQAIDLGGTNTNNTNSRNSSSSNSSSNMSTTVAGNKLAQEIHDEFLTCKICLEGFKSPKSLDCLHTFCEGCIDNHVMSECSYKKYTDYREFTCPLCRKRTQLPLGGVKKLPDNFLVSSLGEVVARQRPSKFPFCDICKLVNRKHREATSKCLDCNKLLCKACVDLHRDTKVTKDHSLFDCEIEKDIECKEHQDEVVRFFCEPCETCICVLCTFNEHKDHEITQFSEAVSKYKEDIQNLLTACKNKTDVYDKQLEILAKCEGIIKNAEQRIHDVAIQFIADIRSREKQLVDELHAMYGSEVMEYVNRKGEMQTNLESLKSTCSLTELVLKGKDIELLLLKKQVQDKLSCLAEVTLKDLPSSVQKQVVFMPGSMELGLLQDMDGPPKRGLLTQVSLPAESSTTSSNNAHNIRTTETQTDPTSEKQSRLVSRYIQTLPVAREEEATRSTLGSTSRYGISTRP
ncbi:E3 ubiquitin-protein ligase TRIM56-like isoform X3 [Babylonia areolata]|uniref:E3 ubiquitin-protein ligase TRIM56-like isoform X3 n=2 Tax=Babylonia areolata TaxID=304850 RepID=UPI003FD08196